MGLLVCNVVLGCGVFFVCISIGGVVWCGVGVCFMFV